MLRCESVAPLGKPVVPDVYWMLIGSSGRSVASISSSAAGSPETSVSEFQDSSPIRMTSCSSVHSGWTSAIIAA